MDPEDEAALLALPPPPTSLLPSSSLPLLPSDDQCSVHVCPWASSPPSSPQQPLCPRTPIVLPIVLCLVLFGLGLGLGLGLYVSERAEQISGVGGSSQAILLLGGTDGASNRTSEIVSGDH